MCVLVLAEKKFPTLAQLEKMEKRNPDGGGMAWVHGGVVCWRKGLTAKEIFDLGQHLPLPLVIHFRMATVGGKQPLLTHPFAITERSVPSLVGSGEDVLFHNGHWSGWEDMMKAALGRGRISQKVRGPMSDTRAMAVLHYAYGSGIAEMLGVAGQKVITMTPTEVQVYGTFSEWEGLLVSNQHFDVCETPTRYDSRDWGGDDWWADERWTNQSVRKSHWCRNAKPKPDWRETTFSNCPECSPKHTPGPRHCGPDGAVHSGHWAECKMCHTRPDRALTAATEMAEAQVKAGTGEVITCGDGIQMVWVPELQEYVELASKA